MIRFPSPEEVEDARRDEMAEPRPVPSSRRCWDCGVGLGGVCVCLSPEPPEDDE